MIVKSMKIQNYRPYVNATIPFAVGEKNITIIQGRNDAGKTSLINAVTWCLYNKEPFRDDGGLEDRWNKSYVKHLANGEKVPVKVEMAMEDNSGREVYFIREQIFEKIGKLSCKEISSPDLKIYIDDDLIPNPEDYVSNNLPEALQEYFIFTGERLTQFFNKDQNLVKDGVHALYQLDLVDNIFDQCKRWETYYSGQFRKINPELDDLKSIKSESEERLMSEKIELRENKEYIDKYKRDIEQLKKARGDEGGDAKEINEKIANLETEKTTKESELETAEKNYSNLLTKSIPSVLSLELLFKLQKWENFEEETTEQEEVIALGLSDLKKLIKQDKCVCGADLTEGSEAYSNLNDLINVLENNGENDKINIESLISNLLNLSNNMIDRYPDNFYSDILESKQKIIELKHEIQSKDIAIDRLGIQLSGLNIEEIERLNGLIEENEKLVESLIARNGVIEEDLKFLPGYIDELNENIEKAEEDMGVKNIYDQKRDFCASLKLIAKEIYDDLAREIIQTLSEKVSEEYKNIHWKPDYQRIIVEPDFQVLVEKNGENVVSAIDPSTGSRNVLALTFMAALNSLSGFTLPQIIDTPIASLDGQMRENVAKSLPKYMEGKQMILLVMDTEYTGEFKVNIDQYVGERRMLEYISDTDDDGHTVVRKF